MKDIILLILLVLIVASQIAIAVMNRRREKREIKQIEFDIKEALRLQEERNKHAS